MIPLPCQFKTEPLDERTWQQTCERCGFARTTRTEVLHRQCHGQPGWGDRLAAVLARFRITSGLVSRLMGRTCNCAGRQAGLNRLGWWILGKMGKRMTTL